MLARRLAIGVRSSWLASATRLRWASTDCSSASSVVLKLAPGGRARRGRSPRGAGTRSGCAVSDSVRRVNRAIGRERRARDDDAEHRGEQDAGRADEASSSELAVERRCRPLSAGARPAPRRAARCPGEHAQVRPRDGGVAVGAAHPRGGDLARARSSTGSPAASPARADDLSVGRDDLHEPAAPPKRGRRGSLGPPRTPVVAGRRRRGGPVCSPRSVNGLACSASALVDLRPAARTSCPRSWPRPR